MSSIARCRGWCSISCARGGSATKNAIGAPAREPQAVERHPQLEDPARSRRQPPGTKPGAAGSPVEPRSRTRRLGDAVTHPQLTADTSGLEEVQADLRALGEQLGHPPRSRPRGRTDARRSNPNSISGQDGRRCGDLVHGARTVPSHLDAARAQPFEVARHLAVERRVDQPGRRVDRQRPGGRVVMLVTNSSSGIGWSSAR